MAYVEGIMCHIFFDLLKKEVRENWFWLNHQWIVCKWVKQTTLKLLLLAAGMQVKKISRLKKEKQNTSISIIYNILYHELQYKLFLINQFGFIIIQVKIRLPIRTIKLIFV